MSDAVLIGIDAGTSMIKAVAFSADGNTLASAHRPNRYRSLDDGGVEQDMRQTRDDTLAVLRELLSAHPQLAPRVEALAVTGQGDGMWLVDAEGEPVQDGWLWLDSRASAEADAIAASDGYDTIYARTGTGVNVCQMRSQLRWMQAHRPDVLARAATGFHCKDYLYQQLTGVRATDPSEAVFTFGAYASRDYCDEVIAALVLDRWRHLLPPVVDGMHESHPLIDTVARQVGLAAGLPVTLGYVDVICSALGGGLYDPARSPGISILGSTGMHMAWVPDAASVTLNDEKSGYTMCFPGGSVAQMQSNMAATLNIDWLLDVACDAVRLAGFDTRRADLLPRLDDAVAAAPAAQLLYHPFISQAGERGPFTDPRARAGFIGLDQSMGFATMLRAVYEGLALAARDCFDAMGDCPSEIRLGGGAARSLMLRQILSAAVDRPVRTVDRDEAGAAGACMIAATAAGLFSDLDACSAAWVDTRLGEVVTPDADLAGRYAALLPLYRDSYRAVQPVWHALASHRRGGAAVSSGPS